MSRPQPMAKVAITIDAELLQYLDMLVAQHYFNNRSQAFQEAMKKYIHKIQRERLAAECDKLDQSFEQSLADEGFDEDMEEWPDY